MASFNIKFHLFNFIQLENEKEIKMSKRGFWGNFYCHSEQRFGHIQNDERSLQKMFHEITKPKIENYTKQAIKIQAAKHRNF